jgi:hypothetical protein
MTREDVRRWKKLAAVEAGWVLRADNVVEY